MSETKWKRRLWTRITHLVHPEGTSLCGATKAGRWLDWPGDQVSEHPSHASLTKKCKRCVAMEEKEIKDWKIKRRKFIKAEDIVSALEHWLRDHPRLISAIKIELSIAQNVDIQNMRRAINPDYPYPYYLKEENMSMTKSESKHVRVGTAYDEFGKECGGTIKMTRSEKKKLKWHRLPTSNVQHVKNEEYPQVSICTTAQYMENGIEDSEDNYVNIRKCKRCLAMLKRQGKI